MTRLATVRKFSRALILVGPRRKPRHTKLVYQAGRRGHESRLPSRETWTDEPRLPGPENETGVCKGP